MPAENETIRQLREAVSISPENVPLRLHLASTLSASGFLDEAEAEYRAALEHQPGSAACLTGLARVYYRLGKNSQALVILEDLVRRREATAEAHVLYSRLLMLEGDVSSAVAQYKLGVEIDDAAADEEFAAQLGITADEEEDPLDEREVVDGRIRQGAFHSGGIKWDKEIERPKIRFDDVGGMEALKDDIRMKIIFPIQHPELYAAYGKTAGGGIMMYGPPGCGKTYFARATAGEIDAAFISVGINDVLEMWLGNSERNLHGLFELARNNTPCVLFFDEADALGGRRSDMSGGSSRQVINQFLAELDGVECSNEGVLVLAATNAPWHVDAAFRRPGRFDQVLFVPPPDAEAREAILKIHCRGKPIESIDFAKVAKKAERFSGADLKAIVDVAVEAKLRESLKAGKPQPLSTSDLLAAARKLKPTTQEWFATARNYALYSNQGGVYDDVMKYLNL
ncbi:MAG: AAA family ATPase [Planctomycetaceae bacterium]|nr:AAA family ATPase [Planctomycetaceae bacterium]